MTEKIMDINAVNSYLLKILKVKTVKIQENERVITIIPIDLDIKEKQFNCPFLGIAAESDLTVEKFLEWKNKEREVEYEKDVHS